jgi:hypothetical protein
MEELRSRVVDADDRALDDVLPCVSVCHEGRRLHSLGVFVMSESAANRLLPRTWMLSKHKYNPRDLGSEVMHVRETKPHALSHANTITTDDQLEAEKRERKARLKFDKLPEIDREILRLHLWRGPNVEREQSVPASMRENMQKAMWEFVRYDHAGRTAVMVRSSPDQHNAEDIGRMVYLSASQVRRRLNALDPALVKFAEMLGWV